MANVPASNARDKGVVLYWGPLGADTAAVWKWVCPVDSHKVLTAVELHINSSGGATGGTAKCPVHDVALGSKTAVTL